MAVFPAYAGMFLWRAKKRGDGPGFPRVCGDVPFTLCARRATRVFSPRMRGCSEHAYTGGVSEEVFPAYAGMFLNLICDRGL